MTIDLTEHHRFNTYDRFIDYEKRHKMYQTAKALGRGPGGRPHCFWCLREIKKGSGRRTFCSDECVDQFCIRRSSPEVQRQVLKRDHGVCSKCGLDTVAIENEFKRLAKLNLDRMDYRARRRLTEQEKDERARRRLAQCELNVKAIIALAERWNVRYVMERNRYPRGMQGDLKIELNDDSHYDRESFVKVHVPTMWEADHIVPVKEGGGCCGLEGYRTLCLACHLEETRALRKRMSERHRERKAARLAESSKRSNDPIQQEIFDTGEKSA